MAPRRGGKSGVVAVRGRWEDATEEAARAAEVLDDPLPEKSRNGIRPGQWPGAPADKLPPACTVTPLGVDGKTAYFIDSLGQLVPVAVAEWGPKMLLHLFSTNPNYVYWAWPRFNEKTQKINGLESNEAMQCLMKAAAMRGIFSPADRVRGRGAWETRTGELLWHAGDRIYRVSALGKLEESKPGEIDGIFYPQRPPITVPWRVAVPAEDSPVHELLDTLRSWNWERPVLDPLLVIGWIGCAFLGGALGWRPHLYTTGDKGVGKSTLHFMIKELLGACLHSTADTTPAGIYQRVQQDSLPCAIDELEASSDNRRAMGVVSLARLASSGAVMYRGGAEHSGVEFALRNTFFMSGINPPPMEPADRSRLALLNLGKLDPSKVRKPPAMDAEVTGRMILRQLMDGWPKLQQSLAYWRGALHAGGIDSRGQDTWGTLLAVSELLLGGDAMEEAGLPVADEQRLGELVARETAQERADALENWVGCLHHMLGSRIEAWKGGEQPSVGSALEDFERGELDLQHVNERLALVDLKVIERDIDAELIDEVPELGPRWDAGERKWRLLCVPTQRSPGLDRLFRESKWKEGVWGSALKQAPRDVVVRHLGNGQNVKINRKAVRCLLVDLAAYDGVMRDVYGMSPAETPAPQAQLEDPLAAPAPKDLSPGRKAKWPAKDEKGGR